MRFLQERKAEKTEIFNKSHILYKMFLARRLVNPRLIRFYSNDYIVMPRTHGHWTDPEDCAKRLMNIVKAHDAVKDSSKVTPEADFRKDIGLDDLDIVEIFLEVEKDYFMEFPDEQVESFKSIKDAVEVISNYRFADTY